MSKVVVLKCESYDLSTVKLTITRGIDLLGGIAQFAKPHEKILLKPNLLVGEVPEKCATTHPSVFQAVAELFIATGATVTYGDSPAFGSTVTATKKSGLEAAAQIAGVQVREFGDGETVHFAEGKQNKVFTIAKAVRECDGVISLPKMKTHGFEKFTGCIKNQFGCIPGLLKGEFHVKLPDAMDFAKMLVDLDNCVHPRLYIMDGIMAMEGNGPRGGNPKKMNVLLLSADPVALDATVCRMIDLDPALVPTVVFGHEFGRGVYDKNEIEILGDSVEQFTSKDFDVDRTPVKPFRMSGILKYLNNFIVAKPVINKNKCIKCGICVNVCPVKPKAVDWVNNDKKQTPAHNYHLCIRCYCCQELCPAKAIDLQKPLIRKLFSRKK